jgi:glucose-6-phosphate 1-dehydrogenase
MTEGCSDTLVFFGATGDLAHKQVFPALYSMIKHGHLHVPVVGVARQGWSLEQLKSYAREAVASSEGEINESAFSRLCDLLRYVDGDYRTRIPSCRCEIPWAMQESPSTTSPYRRACSPPS